MKLSQWAACVYSALTLAVVAFQIALASGAPWGAYAMGGSHPGSLPAPLRTAALVQGGILALFALVVLSRSGLILPRWSGSSRRWIWVVSAFCGLSLLLNLITPSRGERALWAPVAGLLFISSLTVALGKPVSRRPSEP